MKTAQPHTKTPTIEVYVKLAQYPILSDQIRLRMRQELFNRGIISTNDFEFEVKNLALESQIREGLNDPYCQEDESLWQKRLAIVRDIHTDNLFANNLGVRLLDKLINEILHNKEGVNQKIDLTFNPEIAPWALLFHQGKIYESLPPPEQVAVQHHLAELKVVLIKRLISDHLKFIGLAKKVFSIQDLKWIYERMLGAGKIGGKAAGMLLAWKILEKPVLGEASDLSEQVDVPETYFIGSEIIYEFLAANQLERFNNQKYLNEQEQRLQYPKIVAACMEGELPPYLVTQLRELMQRIGKRPFIVRSSSLLEDNLTNTFYGVYESIICPNQGSEEENFQKLLNAIRRIYSNTFNPDAINIRRKYRLEDYDERMAVMIQILEGEQYGRYFFPIIMGYGLTSLHNRKDQSDGFIQLVLGYDDQINIKALNKNQYTIPLNRPKFREAATQYLPGRSPQNHVKAIDLASNSLCDLPLYDVLTPELPQLALIASSVKDGTFYPITANDKGPFALTFFGLTEDPHFIRLMRTILARLEKIYQMPIRLEFLVEIVERGGTVDYQIHILQCHPLD